MTKRWMDIESAPRDGSTIKFKRACGGTVADSGLAAWRTVKFGALFDPISGECFAKEYLATGWMCPDKDFRVPTPTHWKAPIEERM